MSMDRAFLRIALVMIAVPSVVFADTEQTIVQIANIFNIFAGFMFVAAVLIFGAGFTVWLARLGTALRDEGVEIMEWGVGTLFVLDVILGIVGFIERHSQTALYLVALGIIVLFIWMLLVSGLVGGEGHGEKEEHK